MGALRLSEFRRMLNHMTLFEELSHVYVYIYIYICIYICICVCACEYIFIYIHIINPVNYILGIVQKRAVLKLVVN